MVFLKLPSKTTVFKLISLEKGSKLTYLPMEGTKSKTPILGFDNDSSEAQIGQGEADFQHAKEAIRAWAMFPAWTRILPQKTAIEKGETVVMLARFLGLWWRNTCRIVYTIDEPDRFGFAYGTLPLHIESGEELFRIQKASDGSVFYSIKAFSKPRHFFAKIGYPLVRLLQAKFRKDSIKSMQQFLERKRQNHDQDADFSKI